MVAAVVGRAIEKDAVNGGCADQGRRLEFPVVIEHAGFITVVVPLLAADSPAFQALGQEGVVEAADLRVELTAVGAYAEHRPHFRSSPTSTGSWSDARKGVGLPATLFGSGLVQIVLAQLGLTLNSVL